MRALLEVGDRGAVALDVGCCPVPGSFEPTFGTLEDLFGDVELTARLAPATPTTAGEATLRVGVVHTGLLGSFGVDGEQLAVGSRRPVDDGQVTLALR